MMNEFERKIYEQTMHELNEARKECERLQAELAAERQQRQYAEDTLRAMSEQRPEQAKESELERRAWELFSQIPDVTIEQSFYKARSWMYHRDQQRKAGAT